MTTDDLKRANSSPAGPVSVSGDSPRKGLQLKSMGRAGSRSAAKKPSSQVRSMGPDARRSTSSSRGMNQERHMRERMKALESSNIELNKRLNNARAELNFMKKSKKNLAAPAEEFSRLRQTNASLQEAYKEKVRQVDALNTSMASLMAEGRQLYADYSTVKAENELLRAQIGDLSP